MANSTVNISFQEELLDQIDKIAKEEARSRSELIREAARAYIEKKEKWRSIFSYGSAIGKKIGLTEQDVAREVKEARKSGT
jgi:CopG family transcriptional regulator / antitoxin EndoAI